MKFHLSKFQKSKFRTLPASNLILYSDLKLDNRHTRSSNATFPLDIALPRTPRGKASLAPGCCRSSERNRAREALTRDVGTPPQHQHGRRRRGILGGPQAQRLHPHAVHGGGVHREGHRTQRDRASRHVRYRVGVEKANPVVAAGAISVISGGVDADADGAGGVRGGVRRRGGRASVRRAAVGCRLSWTPVRGADTARDRVYVVGWRPRASCLTRQGRHAGPLFGQTCQLRGFVRATSRKVIELLSFFRSCIILYHRRFFRVKSTRGVHFRCRKWCPARPLCPFGREYALVNNNVK